MVSSQISTSQAGGPDSDSSVFSFSVTTPIVCNSDNAEWILDSGSTYHVPNRAWFSNFEKLDRCYTVIGDDYPCNIEAVSYTHLTLPTIYSV